MRIAGFEWDDGNVLHLALGHGIEPEEAEDRKSVACLHPPGGKGRPLLVEQEDELRHRLGARRCA